MSTITGIYDNIRVSPYHLDVIEYFYVKKSLNQHDEACVRGCMSEQTASDYKNNVLESTVCSIHFVSEGKHQMLFSGFLTQIEMEEINGQYEAVLYFTGLTKALDYGEKIIDYQSEAKTYSEIISDKMQGYSNLSYMLGIADKNIPQFLLQYEETDYKFLRRLLSMVHEPIFTRAEGSNGMIYFGKATGGASIDLELVSYEIEYDGNDCQTDRKNGLGASSGREYKQYRAKRKEFLQIGDKVNALGRELYVKAAEYSNIDGVSENSYLLCEEAGLYARKQQNANVTGISLDGTILKTLRDRVKIELDATPKTGESKARWFSYSTAASSSDGSGWYCMPEIGEQVRLYVPTDKEEDAYVISAIRSGGKAAGGVSASGGAGASDGKTSMPENKSLSTKEGQEVKFTEDGAEITCAGQVANIKLNKDGTMEITAMGDMDLTAGNSVSIRAEGQLVMMAQDKIVLKNEMGSSFEMEENIIVNANQIKNNS